MLILNELFISHPIFLLSRASSPTKVNDGPMGIEGSLHISGEGAWLLGSPGSPRWHTDITKPDLTEEEIWVGLGREEKRRRILGQGDWEPVGVGRRTWWGAREETGTGWARKLGAIEEGLLCNRNLATLCICAVIQFFPTWPLPHSVHMTDL